MKNRILSFTFFGSFMIMLCFPKQVFQGASEGLLLWFQVVLPTLLPFMIITTLLLRTNVISLIAKIISPILSPLLGISAISSFAVIGGFLCGYPMGAKLAGDLVRTGDIHPQEGQYLLSFCNNTSPTFILSYVILQNLKDETFMFPTILLTLLTPVFCSFFFRLPYRQCIQRSQRERSEKSVRFHFQMVDESIMNSFEAVTKIGGYIILFSIILTLFRELPFPNKVWSTMLLPMIEITNGVSIISHAALPLEVRYSLMMFLVAFGGGCSVAQSQCMLKQTDIRILPYIIQKLITAAVTSFLSYYYIIIFIK